MSDKSKKLEKQGPYIVIPKKGPYKKRRPWKKWSGGDYKAPKILKYKMGDKEYEFKKGGRVGFKSGTKRKTYTKGCGKVMSNNGLRKWVKEKWVDIGAPKKNGKYQPCGRSKGSKRKYPKCVPLAKATRMTKSQKASAVRRKRAAGNKGPKPTNVKTFA